jgi:hypothetical protein
LSGHIAQMSHDAKSLTGVAIPNCHLMTPYRHRPSVRIGVLIQQ